MDSAEFSSLECFYGFYAELSIGTDSTISDCFGSFSGGVEYVWSAIDGSVVVAYGSPSRSETCKGTNIECMDSWIRSLPCVPYFLVPLDIVTTSLDQTIIIISAITFVTLMFGQLLTFAIIIIRQLSSNFGANVLSENTRKLQKNLLKALIWQTGIPVVYLVLPVTYATFSFSTGYFSMVWNNIAANLASLHGLVSTLSIILIHQPYRDTFGFWCQKKSTSLPCVPDFLVPLDVVTTSLDQTIVTISAVTFVTLVFGQLLTFAIIIYRQLSSNFGANVLSENTRKLQKNLLKALIWQTGIPMVYLVLPVIYATFSFSMGYFSMGKSCPLLPSLVRFEMYLPVWNNIVANLASLHGLVSTLSIILIHKPYRDTFGFWFQKRVTPLHLIGAYCILTKTPGSMHSVKWTLLNFHFWNVLMDLMLNLFSVPFPLYPSASGFLLGVLSDVGVRQTIQLWILITAVCFVCISTMLIFENRFRILYYKNKLWKKFQLYWVVLNIVFSFVIMIPTMMQLPDQIVAREMVFNTLPCIPDFLLSIDIIVPSLDPTIIVVTALVFVIVVFGQLFTFLTMIIVQLSSDFGANMLSESTRKLQKSLMKALIFQTGIPFLYLLVPAVLSMLAITLEIFSRPYNNILVAVTSLHGLFSTLSIILVHQPYRNTVFSWLKKKRTVSTRLVNIYPIFSTNSAVEVYVTG
ncbi:unnamed protein product [Caenorhabditis brenneri]